MATKVIGVCVVRMALNIACEHMESVILITTVKRRKRIQLKLFFEVICVYRCGFTRKGDMSQQIRPIS